MVTSSPWLLAAGHGRVGREAPKPGHRERRAAPRPASGAWSIVLDAVGVGRGW